MQNEFKNTRSSDDIHLTGNSLDKWQHALLPLMRKIITGCAFFFFLTSFVELFYLQSKILKPNSNYINIAINSLSDTTNLTFVQKLNVSKQQALILLESDALERRHHQANVLLMSRIWIKYLGFVTGMIMAFVGAAFILGKFQENESQISSNANL